MIGLDFLKGKTVAVMGLGVAGLSTLRALEASDIDYIAWDDEAESRTSAENEGFSLRDYRDWDWAAIDEFLLSPGIPHTYPQRHPAAAAAQEAGRRILCDVDLLGRGQPDAVFIGVTGTNGKSTTTALVAHILQQAGRIVAVGGNLGPPVLGLQPMGRDGIYVLEMSSYQLERTYSIAFDIALLLNISPDHLDRHGGMAGYVAAKKRIFDGQDADDVAVIGMDDDESRAIYLEVARGGKARPIMITNSTPSPGGVGIAGDLLIDMMGTSPVEVLALGAIATLRGRHNWQNAAAAYAACRALEVPQQTIADAISSFPGLPHRQEIVARSGDIVFINDSKATNQDAAARALDSYSRVYWIAGGLAKEGGYGALLPYLGDVVHAYLIGQAATELAGVLDSTVPGVPYSLSETLDAAARAAYSDAANDNAPGEKVILLSPACASFDQFSNFAARGDAFRDIAQDLCRGARSGGAS